MTYSEYLSDLQHIHQSEVYGENVFNLASKFTFRRDRRAKWILLRNLERQTLAEYLGYMSRTGQVPQYPFIWALRGFLEGALLGLLPWSLAMRLLVHETRHFTLVWARLKENAEPSHREFFEYIYDHEKAIEVFAVRELKHRSDSIQPILLLLGSDIQS